MKILKIIGTSLGAAAVSCLYLSCAKTAPDKVATVDTNFNNKAIVQVFVATVNATRNYVYADAAPLTGSPLVSGSLFPATGYGFNISGGVRALYIKDTLPTTTQLPLSFAENFDAGKHYTIFLYDTITKPKQKTVVDNIVIPADTSSRLRFANFIYNSTDVPAVDVYSYRLGANIFTNVPVTGVTEFISYPSKILVDTLYVRETGTMNLLIKTSISTLTPKHNYTFVYRGSFKGTKVTTLYATY